jgi:hypothetical protein
VRGKNHVREVICFDGVPHHLVLFSASDIYKIGIWQGIKHVIGFDAPDLFDFLGKNPALWCQRCDKQGSAKESYKKEFSLHHELLEDILLSSIRESDEQSFTLAQRPEKQVVHNPSRLYLSTEKWLDSRISVDRLSPSV